MQNINQYDPVGRCIYCHSIEYLTDEHIIPEGLGGKEYLPKASCKNCSVITSKFEGHALREMTWPLRTALGIKGKKRPAKARSSIPDHSKYGLKAVLPVFHEPPGILVGKSATNEVGFDFDLFYDPTTINEKGAPGSYIDISLTPFAQMLAKIAHAYAAAIFGIDGFESFLTDVILGQNDKWPYLIGCTPIGHISPDSSLEHLVKIYPYPQPEILRAHIHLFAHLDTPVYEVAIGHIL